MNSIIHPITGQKLFLGRNRPAPHVMARRRLRLEDYVMPILPKAPPGPLGRLKAALPAVERAYGNLQVGDCTKAGQAHLIGVYTGNANPPAALFADQQVLGDYYRMTGGLDTGLDEITVLEDWRDNPNGLFGGEHQIRAFLTIDAGNFELLRQAIWLFGGLFSGEELPDEWINNPPSGSGFVWDVAAAPNPANGHCTVAVDYTDQGLITLTWGMWGIMTWPAVKKYLAEADGGELHVPVTEEVCSRLTKMCVAGIKMDQLIDDAKHVPQIS